MKERPIIFNAPMVQAFLEGRKTQTRRSIKPSWSRCLDLDESEDRQKAISGCPFGAPGDLLWVREKWRIGAWDENRGAFAVDYCDGPRKEWLSYQNDEDGDKFQRLWIECSDELAALGIMPDADGDYHWKPGESPLRWRSPLYMPRIASRITLEITNVRIQRLTEISVSEIAAEGWERREDITNNEQVHAEAALDRFTDLWESAHGPDSLSKNPYV